jgi:hypothetical protein
VFLAGMLCIWPRASALAKPLKDELRQSWNGGGDLAYDVIPRDFAGAGRILPCRSPGSAMS